MNSRRLFSRIYSLTISLIIVICFVVIAGNMARATQEKAIEISREEAIGTNSNDSTFVKKYNELILSYQQHDYEKVVKEGEYIIENYPNSLDSLFVYILLSNAYRSIGNEGRANVMLSNGIQLANSIIDNNANNLNAPTACFMKGLIYLSYNEEIKYLENAEQCFNEVINLKITGNSADIYKVKSMDYKAKIYVLKEDYDKAIDQYKEIINSTKAMIPFKAEAQMGIATVYNTQAIQAYKKVLRNYPSQKKIVEEAKRRLSLLTEKGSEGPSDDIKQGVEGEKNEAENIDKELGAKFKYAFNLIHKGRLELNKRKYAAAREKMLLAINILEGIKHEYPGKITFHINNSLDECNDIIELINQGESKRTSSRQALSKGGEKELNEDYQKTSLLILEARRDLQDKKYNSARGKSKNAHKILLDIKHEYPDWNSKAVQDGIDECRELFYTKVEPEQTGEVKTDQEISPDTGEQEGTSKSEKNEVEDPSKKYREAYLLIQEARKAINEKYLDQARASIKSAQAILRDLKDKSPDWNSSAVEARLEECNNLLNTPVRPE